MTIKRHFIKKLLNWKTRPTRKPLIVRGARQVGKTYAITEFGQSFQNLVTVDFEKQRNIRKIFEGDLEVKDILAQLELASGQRIIPGTTLLFFDEIQLCPRALMSLRYFFEDLPELHVVAAGSLLEFELEKISFPVGRVEFDFLYPMTFEEFLEATENEPLAAQLPSLETTKPLPEFVHNKFLEEARKYCIVGGMPEAVACYVKTGSFQEVAQVHESLLHAILQDLLKYERKAETELLQSLFEKIPRLVGQTIIYSHLEEGTSHYKIKQTLKILEQALMIHRIIGTSAQKLPLGSQSHDKPLKYVFLDVGWMQFICGAAASDILNAEDLLNTYQGALCEQFVGQEILAAGGSEHHKLYFWNRLQKGSHAEVDYLLARNGKIFPIEVKKGPTGRLKSLHLLLKESPTLQKGYVLNSGNIGQIDKIHFRPFYTKLNTEENKKYAS